MDMKRRKKYIVIGVALATVGTAFTAGAAMDLNNKKYNAKYTARSNYSEATLSDADTGEKTASDILNTISESVDFKEKDVYKDETVYVFSAADGEVTKILVNEHLKNKDGAGELKDVSDLKDITNMKGYEEYIQEGDKLTWKAEGNDIYYQGTTDKKLPVSVKVTYYLDGKEIAPEELAGKSGKVTIRYDYSNDAVVSKEIDGKKTDIKVPFVAVTGMVLNPSFKNVSVTNGKAIEEGESDIVIGYALPGLAESLALESEDIEVPDYFEVTADVTDFKMEMTVTMIANGSGVTMGGKLDFGQLDELITAISGAGSDLSEGAEQVSGGAGTISEKMGELNTGIGTLNTGIATIKTGTETLAEGVGSIDTSAQSINTGISALDTALNAEMSEEEKKKIQKAAQASVTAAFAEGTDTYNTIYESAKTSFNSSITGEATVQAIYLGLYDNLYETLYQAAAAKTMAAYQVNSLTKEQKQGIKAQVETNLMELATGIAAGIAANGEDTIGKNVVGACQQAASNAAGTAAVSGAEGAKAQIAASIEEVQENGYSLVTGASALAAGTTELNNSMPEFTKGVNSLSKGSAALVEGASQLETGASTLATGASALKEGIDTLNNDVISSIVEAYDGNVKAFADRMTAIAEAATEYDTFTLLGDDDEGTTKFIIKTEGIYVE